MAIPNNKEDLNASFEADFDNRNIGVLLDNIINDYRKTGLLLLDKDQGAFNRILADTKKSLSETYLNDRLKSKINPNAIKIAGHLLYHFSMRNDLTISFTDNQFNQKLDRKRWLNIYIAIKLTIAICQYDFQVKINLNQDIEKDLKILLLQKKLNHHALVMFFAACVNSKMDTAHFS